MNEELKTYSVEEVSEIEEFAEELDAAASVENAGEVKGQGEKKYTDDDVNKIVQKRLAKERERVSKAQAKEQKENEFIERENNLLKRELKVDAKDVLASLGIPRSAAEMLNYNSKEEYDESMARLNQFITDLRDMWDKERATGHTPRNITNKSYKPDIRSAFKP